MYESSIFQSLGVGLHPVSICGYRCGDCYSNRAMSNQSPWNYGGCHRLPLCCLFVVLRSLSQPKCPKLGGHSHASLDAFSRSSFFNRLPRFLPANWWKGQRFSEEVQQPQGECYPSQEPFASNASTRRFVAMM